MEHKGVQMGLGLSGSQGGLETPIEIVKSYASFSKYFGNVRAARIITFCDSPEKIRETLAGRDRSRSLISPSGKFWLWASSWLRLAVSLYAAQVEAVVGPRGFFREVPRTNFGRAPEGKKHTEAPAQISKINCANAGRYPAALYSGAVGSCDSPQSVLYLVQK